jgi:hypothetical protein
MTRKALSIVAITLSFLSICTWMVQADVSSTSNVIYFDSNNDSVAEMTLNNDGLGIGGSPSTNLHVTGNAIVTSFLSVGGTNIYSANLNVHGSIGLSSSTITANATLSLHSTYFADSSAGNVALVLPYAGNVSGRKIRIKKTSPLNNVWINGGGNHIDSKSELTMGNTLSGTLPYLEVISNGQQWYSLNQTGTSASVATSNTMFHYQLEETSGTAVGDSSPYGRHGALNLSTTFSSNSSANGAIGRCLALESGPGTSAGISGPALNTVTDGNVAAVSFWLKASSANIAAWKNILFAIDTNIGIKIQQNNATGQLRYRVETNSGPSAESATSVSLDDTWHHHYAEWDAGSIRVYQDSVRELLGGSETFSYSHGTGFLSSATIKWLASDSMTGFIDDIRFFNRTLSSAEIEDLYQLGVP